MPTQCFSAVQGVSLRVTRLDSCCNVVFGQCSTVVSESFVTFSATAEIEEPTEILVKTAAGRICINELGVATLKRYNVELEFCQANPDLFEIISGANPVLDFNGDVVGYSTDQNLGAGTKFALEIWSRVPADICENGGFEQFVYYLFPCLTNGRLGDVTIEDGAVTFNLTAAAIHSDNWNTGPYEVVASDASNTPSQLLAAIPEDTGYYVQLTTIAPPTANEADCGCQPLAIIS